MPERKYLKIDITDGKTKEETSVSVSGGPTDEGKIPALDSGGKLDLTLMPTGIGPDLKSLPVGVDVNAGDFVTIYDDAGTLKVKPALADVTTTQCDGFVKETIAAGNPVRIYFEGVNDQISGLTPGDRLFLSNTVAGAVMATPPADPGNVVQFLGRAVSASEIAYEATDGITLA
jgi:hypothetical protein